MASRSRQRPGAFAVLALGVLVAVIIAVAPCPARAKTALSINALYGSEATARNCLNNIWRVASQRLRGPEIPNCLRFAFHDAGTYATASDDGGANGSILNELDAAEHNGLSICANATRAMIQNVRAVAGCSKASAADIIQVAGVVAVYMAGGPACSVLMGRPDVPTGTRDVTSRLPNHCGTAAQLLAGFTSNGFSDPTTSLAVLSGAHNIGNSRVTQRSACSRGIGPLTNNSASLDGHYYNSLLPPPARDQTIPSPGWFKSDNELYRGGNAALTALVTQYASNHQSFLDAWCRHHQEFSLLGVNPSPYTVTGGWLPATLPPRG